MKKLKDVLSLERPVTLTTMDLASSESLDGILTFGGKDAAAEFDMIHPPDVVEKYAPDAIFGVLGSGKPKKAKGAAKSALPVATDMKVDTSLKWFASSCGTEQD